MIKDFLIERNLDIKYVTRFLSTPSALLRAKKRDTCINTVIDVGASNGSWSLSAMKYYPEAFYFLVEAQKPHEEALIKVKKQHKNIDYILSAAGDREGEIYFDNSDLYGGLASDTPFEKKLY